MNERLYVDRPIVFQNGTMSPHFRDYLLKIVDSIRAYRDESLTTYTVAEGDANHVLRFTGASPAVTIPTGICRDGDEISIRQAGSGTLVLTTTGLTINGTIPAWAQHVEVKFRRVNVNEWDVV